MSFVVAVASRNVLDKRHELELQVQPSCIEPSTGHLSVHHASLSVLLLLRQLMGPDCPTHLDQEAQNERSGKKSEHGEDYHQQVVGLPVAFNVRLCGDLPLCDLLSNNSNSDINHEYQPHEH